MNTDFFLFSFSDFQFYIKPISWCKISGQPAVCMWFSLQFHLPCQMSSLLLPWWIGIILWPWFWTEMYVALTMITHNSLPRKQHSSGNRKGQIILSYNWKPRRVTLYPAVSLFSSRGFWTSCLPVWYKLSEGGMEGKNEGKNWGNLSLSMMENSEAEQALAAVESGQGLAHPHIFYWELRKKEWTIPLSSWMFPAILVLSIRKVYMCMNT